MNTDLRIDRDTAHGKVHIRNAKGECMACFEQGDFELAAELLKAEFVQAWQQQTVRTG